MSDAWINALVQSPLMRTLNSVQARATNFVYGIPDNVAPFSFDKVVVSPNYGGDGTTDVVRFRIPQNGYWNRAYLRVYVKRPGVGAASILNQNYGHEVNGSTGAAIATTDRLQHTVSSAWNAARIIKEVSIQAHNKMVSRMYGDTIVAKCRRLPKEEADIYGDAMRGWCHETGDPANPNQATNKLPWLPNVDCIQGSLTQINTGTNLATNFFTGADNAGMADIMLNFQRYVIDPSTTFFKQNAATSTLLEATNAENIASKYALLLVPLPFDFFENPSKNLNTRFVEDLELWVTKQSLSDLNKWLPYPSNAAGINTIKMELVCVYHTFHESVESAIRNKNFKKGIPATILSTDDVQESNVVGVSSNPGPMGSVADISAQLSTQVTNQSVTSDLRSNHLITSLTVVHTRKVGHTGLASNAWDGFAADLPGSNVNPLYSSIQTGTNGGHSHGMIPLEPISIRITGSGRTLYETSFVEGPLDLVSYKLLDKHAPLVPYLSHARQVLTKYGGYEYNPTDAVTMKRGVVTPIQFATRNPNHINSYINGGLLSQPYENNCTTLRFAFDDDDRMNTGALALQGIADPKVVITFPRPVWSTDYVKVYVQYKCLVRIDSDTGAIMRTMDV